MQKYSFKLTNNFTLTLNKPQSVVGWARLLTKALNYFALGMFLLLTLTILTPLILFPSSSVNSAAISQLYLTAGFALVWVASYTILWGFRSFSEAPWLILLMVSTIISMLITLAWPARSALFTPEQVLLRSGLVQISIVLIYFALTNVLNIYRQQSLKFAKSTWFISLSIISILMIMLTYELGELFPMLVFALISVATKVSQQNWRLTLPLVAGFTLFTAVSLHTADSVYALIVILPALALVVVHNLVKYPLIEKGTIKIPRKFKRIMLTENIEIIMLALVAIVLIILSITKQAAIVDNFTTSINLYTTAVNFIFGGDLQRALVGAVEFSQFTKTSAVLPFMAEILRSGGLISFLIWLCLTLLPAIVVAWKWFKSDLSENMNWYVFNLVGLSAAIWLIPLNLNLIIFYILILGTYSTLSQRPERK